MHSGRGSFVVRLTAAGRTEVLVDRPGPYQGARPLGGDRPLLMDVQADGPWTLRLEALVRGDTPGFSGRGDAVGPLFDPPGAGAWELTHDGQREFIVEVHCLGTGAGAVTPSPTPNAAGITPGEVVVDATGRVAESRTIAFRPGPCFWEVQADGNWSLRPRT